MSLLLEGLKIFTQASIFEGCGCNPFLLTNYLKLSICSLKKLHFFGLGLKPAALSCLENIIKVGKMDGKGTRE